MSTSSSTRTTFAIRELCCASEEQLLRRVIGGTPGVSGLTFDIVNSSMTVEHDEAVVVADALAERVRSAGMTPRVASGESGATTDVRDERHDSHDEPGSGPSRRELLMLGLGTVLAFAAEIASWTIAEEGSIGVLVASAAVILLAGLPTLRKGWIALRTFTLNINFLMTVAVVGAFAIGEYPEAAVVVVLFAIAELVERYSLERARNAVRALMEVAPSTAWVKRSDGSFAEVDAGAVAVGSIVRVRSGERLPLDGVVVSGESAVNQAPITGESIPVDKKPGDQVFAGAICENGVLEVRTTGGRDQTTIARIVRTVQEAQAQRAPTQRFVDAFARVYTPIVCVIAVLVAVAPPLLLGWAWSRSIYEALVLLVIACPCALVISTPVTVVSGLASAAKRGILIKGGVYLEEGRKLRVIAVDKTGTITAGRPSVVDVRPLGGRSADEVLRLAASLDAGSDHPIARAITGAWTSEKAAAAGALLPVAGFATVTGKGVQAVMGNRGYFLGNHRFAHERGVCTPEVEAMLSEVERQGQTAVVLTDERETLGIVAVADTIRETSVQAVRELHELGIRTVLLTGDNQSTASAVGARVGIDDTRGELLPDDKLRAIGDLLTAHGVAGVGMVGDGINDAPALAKSSIGFAMGAAGTDTAIETADVALMRDDLRGVPLFIRLSRRTSQVLKQNIALAIGIKVVFFVLALIGIATVWMAVLADMGSSLLVVGNGLRLIGMGKAEAEGLR